jgi:hypothetical protein
MSGSAGGSMILREFLMRLGYSEDESSRRKFLDSVKYMTTAMIGLGTAVATASAAVVAGVAKMASVSEGMYYMSQRTGSSVKDINALKYAFSQLGGSAEQAQGLIERFANKMRESPGFEQLVRGITGKPFAGAVEGIKDLGTALNDMLNRGTSYSQVRTIAEQLGLTEEDLMVLLRNTRQFTEEYGRMADKIIGNQQKVAEHGRYFMQRYRAFLEEIELFAERIGDDLAVSLGDDLEKLRNFLFRHADEIKAGIDTFARGIIIAGRGIAQFAIDAGNAIGDVIAWFKKLDPMTKLFIEGLTAIGVAWVILNSKFVRSPLGIVTMLSVALVELYTDWQNWKKGADHFIDWDRWEPQIRTAIAGLSDFAKSVDRVVHSFIGPNGWTTIAEAFLIMFGTRWVVGVIAAFTRAGAAALGFTAKLAPVLAIMAAIDLWNKAHEDTDVNELPVGSPLWQNVPEAERRKYANSPENQLELNQGGAGGGGVPSWWPSWLPRPGLAFEGRGVGSGGDAALDAKGTEDPKLKQAYDTLISLGRSPSAAAGIVANMYAESKLNPTAHNASGHAGIGQHSIERQQHWFEYLRMQGKPLKSLIEGTLDEQIRFYDWEVRKYEPEANTILENAQTPGAGALGGIVNERPEGYHGPGAPGPHYQARAALAQQLDRRFRPGGVPLPAGPPVTTTEPSVPRPGDHVPGTLSQTYPSVATPPAGVAPSIAPPATTAPAGASIQQTNHFHADSVTNPREAINALTRQLDRHNADLLRNGNSNVG